MYRETAKAMRALVEELIKFPEWATVTKLSGIAWSVQPDFLGAQSVWRMEVSFQGTDKKGKNAPISHVHYETDEGHQLFTVPWNDPDCDKKIAKLILDWLILTWDEKGLKEHGDPKPTLRGGGGARPKRGGRGA